MRSIRTTIFPNTIENKALEQINSRACGGNLIMIETSRLLLRPQRIEDFELYKAIWINDPNLSEGVQVLPGLTDEQSWDRLLRWIGHWNVFGYGPLLVIDRQTGELVGETGVARFHRGNGPAFRSEFWQALWRIDIPAMAKAWRQKQRTRPCNGTMPGKYPSEPFA